MRRQTHSPLLLRRWWLPLADSQPPDVELLDLELSDLRPPDGKAVDGESSDREAANCRGADREGADRGRPARLCSGRRRRTGLGPEGGDGSHGRTVAPTLPTIVSASPETLLVVQHVPWEGPHRILEAFDGLPVRMAQPLDGDPLPDPAEVAGALLMGGPMGVGDTEIHPPLATEREWLSVAIAARTPILGVCLGAQLIASALGADVRAGPAAEIGFATVRIRDPADPILGPLAPDATVLHWHSEVFDLPEEAELLAWSAQTPVQAFRFANAWGVLFHPEADSALVERWLAVAEMADDARDALGPDAASILRSQAADHEADLTARSAPGFRAFAEMVA
jgi:GMP synthase (glutamine-hydrolysing)